MKSGPFTAFFQANGLAFGVFVVTGFHDGASDQYARHPGFICFKSFRAIRYERRWFRQALVMAALDRSITQIGPCPTEPHHLPTGVEFAFWARTAEFSQIVLLSTERVERQDAEVGMPTRNFTRSELTSHPSAAFAKAIWAQKRLMVAQREHHAIARTVCRRRGGIRLDALVEQVGRELGCRGDIRFEAVYALIANGYLETDVARGMLPDTKVYPGPLLAEDWSLPPTLGNRDEGQLELFASRMR